jgi:hypothetical protein
MMGLSMLYVTTGFTNDFEEKALNEAAHKPLCWNQRRCKFLGPPDYCPPKHPIHYGNVEIWTPSLP